MLINSIFSKWGGNFNLHIPHDLGVPVIWFDKPVYIDNTLMLSNVVGKIEQYEYDFEDDEERPSEFEEANNRRKECRKFIEELMKKDEADE